MVNFLYGFWVLLYGFRRTLPLLWVVVPGATFAMVFYFALLLGGIEPWWFGLVRLDLLFAFLLMSS